jgi:hypothetical protein
VNEAVDNYLDVQAARLETDLEATLQRVKAYRAADPDFEHAIARFAEAEAEHAAEDPVEGSTVRARGPAQRLVRELIARERALRRDRPLSTTHVAGIVT